jgi:hypothetical protein
LVDCRYEGGYGFLKERCNLPFEQARLEKVVIEIATALAHFT